MFDALLQQTQQSVATLASALRRWLDDPLLKSTTVTVVIPAGESSVLVHHGLGRAYNGAIVLGMTRATLVSVSLPGVDAGKTLTVSTDAAVSPSDLTIKLRVF